MTLFCIFAEIFSLHNTMDIQKHLFETVKKKIAKRDSLTSVIEDLLGVSSDSAYRRISGKTEITFSELQKICGKFNISMDEILNYKSNQGALFQYGPLVLSDQESSINQLERILKILDGLKSASEKEILYLAMDVPYYHFAKFPDLAFFRQYVWYDSMNRSQISYNEFCRQLDKEKMISIFEKFHNTMMFIPVKEVWTDQTIDPILRLLEHYYETGAFESKDTVLSLLDQLNSVFDMLKQYAEDGHKGGERKTPYFQYLSYVDLESGIMLLRKDDQLLCSIRLNTINSISTDNDAICTRLQKWMDNIIYKSVQISSISVMERTRFYRTSKNKIDALREKIKSN